MSEWIRAAVVAAAVLCVVPRAAGVALGERPVARAWHRRGHARWMEDRFTPAAGALPPAPAGKRVRLAPRARIAAADPRLVAALAEARRVRDGLAPGVPRDELSAVIATAETLDVTPSRLNAVELTLKRNAEFWAFARAARAGHAGHVRQLAGAVRVLPGAGPAGPAAGELRQGQRALDVLLVEGRPHVHARCARCSTR